MENWRNIKYYQISQKTNAEVQIEEFIREHPNEAGIVYRTTRQAVEDTAKYLGGKGIRTLPYHAGMNIVDRNIHQDLFSRDEVDVIVATIAFGMGIDKSNVRFVIHADLPRSIENYYQETGRAGRDGAPAHCLLLFSRRDIPRVQYFINQIEDPDEKARSQRVLKRMVAFAGSTDCRRKALLRYFGEDYPRDTCDACDSCAGDVNREEATDDAQKILSTIAGTGQRFGASHIVDIVTGASTKKIRSFGHDRLSIWGAGKEKNKHYWRGVMDQLLNRGIVLQTIGKWPILQLGDCARDVLEGSKQVFVSTEINDPAITKKHSKLQQFNYNQNLFESLRSLRLSIAQSQKVPPFVVFSDRSLHEMAANFPCTEYEFKKINGVGAVKLKRYGEQFITLIKKFLDKHPEVHSIGSPGPTRMPRSRRRRRENLKLRETYEKTWVLLKEGKTYQEIATTRGLSPQTIGGHIERLVDEGRPVDFDRILDENIRNRIAKAFIELKTSNLKPVVEKLDGSISFIEARLTRAWLKQNKRKV